jgi:beta-phosphoglucomutase-like phosphatase (HAD superfamily)
MTAGLRIFDCDGVLIDREIIACRTDASCLVEVGVAITAEGILERNVGVSAKAMFVVERRPTDASDWNFCHSYACCPTAGDGPRDSHAAGGAC